VGNTGSGEAIVHDDDVDRVGDDAPDDDTVLVPRRDHAVGDAPDDDTVLVPRRDDDTPTGAPDDDTVLVPRRADPTTDVPRAPEGPARPARDTPGVTGVPGAPTTGVPAPPAASGPGVRGGAAPGLPADDERPERVPSVRIGGVVHRLDRPLIVGRRPALPRIVRGPTPELVTVPSRHRQVSSSHVRISVSGDAVVIEDLGSTNGTLVRPAGSAPTRMPSGASMVVLTGTVVEIGDGTTIEILSPYLRVPPPHHGADRSVPWPTAPNEHGTSEPRERS
jgi:hypothetical protein